jgi:hypothetical protein
MSGVIEIDGAAEASAAIAALGEKVEAEIARAVTASALRIDMDVKQRIQRGPKTGRVYTRGRGRNMSREHQASAPGQAPATDTGVLVSSITFRQVSPLTAEVESRLDYAYYLEFGTRFIAQRPSWLPAVEKERPNFARAVAEAIRRASR